MTHPALVHGGVYAITDGSRADLADAVEAALAGGVRLLQYRDKSSDAPTRATRARTLQALCARHAVPLLIDNDAVLAAAVGAAGVHLGRHDVDVGAARATLGDQAIIGVSCYADIERARALAASGADYLSFGAFHPSPTKPGAALAAPELLRQAAALGLPRVAIGGITPDNGAALVAAGADYLAVVSALFGAPDVGVAARHLAGLFPASQTDSR